MDEGYRPVLGTSARAAWLSPDSTRRQHYNTAPQWMGRSWHGRANSRRRKVEAQVAESAKQTVYVQIVPGPNNCWQVIRVDLGSPFARGFLSPDQARRWIARAMKAGILPESVVEVESPTDANADIKNPDRGKGDAADAT